MRILWLVALAVIGTGIALAAAPAPTKGLLVHEWGVISVYDDLELANADMRSMWQGLPGFIYGNVDRRQVPVNTLRMEPNTAVAKAPVIYLHTDKDIAIHLKVEFPGGRPAVWWPANSNVALSGGRRTIPGTHDKQLEWQLTLQTDRPARQPAPAGMRPLPDGHWMEACRDVAVAEVAAAGGSREIEREKFVYYDGIIPSPKAAELKVAAGQVSFKNRAKYPLFDVTVVDRRVAGKFRVARAATVAAGAEVQTLEFKESAADRWPGAGVNELVSQLTAAGLNEDEARAMAAVWKKEFFETEGLTLFYRLPQAEYDRLLPLTVQPIPEKMARVMLVHQPHCEPDLAARVTALIRQLDSNEFQERVDAQRALKALGSAGFVHMLRAHNGLQSLEVTARLNKLLEELESERAFKTTSGPGE